MKIKKTENKLCLNCMKVHQVDTVEVREREVFKGQDVDYLAIYEYCSIADGFLETEPMIRANNLAMKDAYRVNKKLLTSDEIRGIRDRYAISQKDLALALDWGLATITRYETHQVQDRVHDDVLRKIADDPAWFLGLPE